MAAANWSYACRTAREVSQSAADLSTSLIDEDFRAAGLAPLKRQCKDLYKALMGLSRLPAENVPAGVMTAVDNAKDSTLNLLDSLTLMIRTSNRLRRLTSDTDIGPVEAEWLERRRIVLKVAPASADMLDAFDKAIEKSGLIDAQTDDNTDKKVS
jgi:hypothetical protein